MKTIKKVTLGVMAAGMLLQASSCAFDPQALLEAAANSVITDWVFGLFHISTGIF